MKTTEQKKKEPVTISIRSEDLKFLDHISYQEAGQIMAFIGQYRERNKRRYPNQ